MVADSHGSMNVKDTLLSPFIRDQHKRFGEELWHLQNSSIVPILWWMGIFVVGSRRWHHVRNELWCRQYQTHAAQKGWVLWHVMGLFVCRLRCEDDAVENHSTEK